MRRNEWLFSVALNLMAGCSQAEPVPYGGQTVSFAALPVVTDPSPLNDHVRYVGGYAIEAHDTSQVHGLSDLEITPDGKGLRVEAISDLGAAISFSLRPNSKGGLADSPVTLDLLRQDDGQTYNDRNANDAEDTAIDAATGVRYVAFERRHRILAYASWKEAGQRVALGGLPAFPTNSGMEGLAFADGALVVGAESGGFWRCPLATGACRALEGPSPPGIGYMLSSLAVVPGHSDDLLALYRYYDPFTGPRNVLSHVRLEGEKLVKVADLAKIAPPLRYDNYEGVAAVPTASGFRLYLISDGLHDDDKPHLLIYDWTR